MKKVIKISKHKLDLASVELTGPSLLIGRSPLCDQILRAPGVKPIQFLLEWIGEGEFDPDSGMWSLFDMGHLLADNEEDHEDIDIHEYSAEGVVIDDSDDLRFLGFNWSLVEDRFKKTHIEKGILTEHIKSTTGQKTQLDKSRLAIEIVRLDKKDQKVLDVAHYFDSKFKTHHFDDKLPIGVIWKKSDKVSIRFSNKPMLIFDLRGNKIPPAESIDMNLQDSIIVHFEQDLYLIRFVSKVNFSIENDSIFKNKFVLFSLFSFALFAFLLMGIQSVSVENQKNVIEPEVRVVKILEPAPAPVPSPKVAEIKPPEPIKEEVKEIPKEEPKVEPKLVEKPVEIKPKEMVLKENIKPKKAKNPPALQKGNTLDKKLVTEKVTDVNAVGLLAKFKTSGAPVNKQISAESISESIKKDKFASHDNAGVLVHTSQKGIVNEQVVNNKKNNLSNLGSGTLDEADSNVKAAKDFSTNDTAPLAQTTSTTGTAVLGVSTGKTLKGTLGKAGNGSSNDGGEINGGLSKNQVFTVINEHRREIRTCYESALLIRNDLNGIMRLSFGINIAGSVTEVKVVNSELNSSILESCIIQVIRQMKFPESQNQLPTTVIYPFVFKRSS